MPAERCRTRVLTVLSCVLLLLAFTATLAGFGDPAPAQSGEARSPPAQELTAEEEQHLATFNRAFTPHGTIKKWLDAGRYEAAARAYRDSETGQHWLRQMGKSRSRRKVIAFQAYLDAYHPVLGEVLREGRDVQQVAREQLRRLARLDPETDAAELVELMRDDSTPLGRVRKGALRRLSGSTHLEPVRRALLSFVIAGEDRVSADSHQTYFAVVKLVVTFEDPWVRPAIEQAILHQTRGSNFIVSSIDDREWLVQLAARVDEGLKNTILRRLGRLRE